MFLQECNESYISLVLFNTQTAINLLFHCSFLCNISVAPESWCGTVTPSGISVCLSKLFSPAALASGTAVAQWLGCCATNRKVAGSIPAGVSRFFIDIKSF